MRTLFISFVIFLSGAIANATFAQVQVESGKTIEKKIEHLKEQKIEIAEKEKALLKEEVKKINERLKEGEITREKAEVLKKEAAKKRALNIENQQDIIDANIALLERNQDEGYYIAVNYGEEEWEDNDDKNDFESMVSPYIAFGLNNAIIEGQTLEDSPYKIWGSRFFEVGLEVNTSLTKNRFLRLKYGIAWQSNGLKPENNLFFVNNGNETTLANFPFELEKAKLSLNNIVVPVHFEIGPVSDGKEFKLGLGGYAGLNVTTVQKLKFEDARQKIKSKRKGNYNTSDFIYGLSAYIGYDWYALYIKYDMNSIFKDNVPEQHNISLGIRLAM